MQDFRAAHAAPGSSTVVPVQLLASHNDLVFSHMLCFLITSADTLISHYGFLWLSMLCDACSCPRHIGGCFRKSFICLVFKSLIHVGRLSDCEWVTAHVHPGGSVLSDSENRHPWKLGIDFWSC